MEADGARIYIIDETAADDSRAERLIRLARLYAAEEAMPLPQTLCIAKGEYGKPYFENVPWLHFSVSHSGGLWVCALCRCDVGIDIEQHAARDHAALARRFFHPNEIEYTRRGGTEAFYSVWTAKESYVKLLGTGIEAAFRISALLSAARYRAIGSLPASRPSPCGKGTRSRSAAGTMSENPTKFDLPYADIHTK